MKEMVKGEKLIVGNYEKKTRARWTRVEGEKRSTIDYVLMTASMDEIMEEITIDEEKMHSLLLQQTSCFCQLRQSARTSL